MKIRSSTRFCWAKDNAGTAALEFAIVGSIFILIVLGILCYGLYFGIVHGVTQLAADAARVSIAGMTDTERESLAKDHVHTYASTYTLLNPDKITSIEAAPVAGDPNEFRVSITYDASQLPIWTLSGIVPLPSSTIISSASIRRGGY